jgi:hypothetical protein
VDGNGKDAGEDPDADGSPAAEPADDGGGSGADDLGQVLSNLNRDGALQVERIAPAHASGWLDDVQVRAGQESNLLGTIRQHFGGGTFRLRAKRKQGDGRLVYTRGSAVVEVAGEPTFRGKRYNPDGTFVDDKPPPPVAAPAAAPVVLPQPTNQVELLGALAQILQGQQPSGQSLQGVPEIVSALANTARPAPVDPYAGIERALGLLAKFRQATGEGGGEPWEGEGMGGMGNEGQLLALLMSQQQQQPQPMWNGQTWVWPTPPPWMQQQRPTQQQPTQQQPTQQQPTQQQPTQQQPTATAEPVEEVGPDEPYTVGEVLDAVQGLDDAQKMEFLSGLGDVLPASVATQIEAAMREREATT